MTTDHLLTRLRAADPAPVIAEDHGSLYRQIVAEPGDPRLAAGRPASPRRRGRTLLRPLPLLAALVVVAGAAAATTGVIGRLSQFVHAQPRQLFVGNPARAFPGAPAQVVIPRSVRRAVSFTVPGDGTFEFWIALSRRGWLCEAIRQPDGSWADLPNPHDRFQLGGPVPGCEGFFWHDRAGFAYYPTSAGTRLGAWRVVYGYAPQTGHPVAVRDRVTGATAPIGAGRYFAIVIPLCRGARCARRIVWPRPFQLQTLDRSRRVLVRDAIDPGM